MENKLMNHVKNLTPFILFSFLSLASQAMVFISNIIVANKVSVHEFGIYSIIISVVNLLVLFGCQWHNSMVHYCGSREIAEDGSMRQTNQVRIFLLIACYTIIGLFLLLFSNYVDKYVGGKFSALIYLLVISKGITETFTAYFIARKSRNIAAAGLFAIGGTTIIFFSIFKINVVTIMKIQIIANLFFLFFIPFTHRNDFKNDKISKEFFKYCITFALWQLVGSIAVYMISFGDTYIIKAFLGYKEIAKYNAAYKIFSSTFNASNIIASFYVANISKAIVINDHKAIRKIFHKERVVIFSICIAVHILLIVFSDPIISVLYQNKYNDSSIIFRILMIASLVRYWTVFEMMYFNATGKIKVQQLLNIISAFLKILLGVLFLQAFGLNGLAWSTTISTIMVGLLSFMLSEKEISQICK
jgi:O-antigen/teichoic acid export membrane protein